MFNYFACRKIAEDELNKSLKDVVEFKKQQKMKCKQTIDQVKASRRMVVNVMIILLCFSDKRQVG